MRIIDITHPPQSLWIGREGENTFRPVSFECANWFSAYPNATIVAYYQPYGASDPYPLVLTVDGTKRIWHPLLAELVKGDGELQIVLMNGDTVGTSAIIPTKVDRSLISNADHPASETPAWPVKVVQDVEEAASHYPKIVNDYWWVWDVQTDTWVNTGVKARGEGGGGAVDSVNGKTGVVVLDASDVKALPDSTVIPVVPQMATATDMSDWTSGKTVDAATLKTDFNLALLDLDDLHTNKADKTEIPTAVSDLTNDSNFQTAAQVQSAIAAIPDELPTVTSSDNGKFLRVVSGAWAAQAESFQTQAITDTGGYYTTDTVEGALQEIGAELSGINTLIGSGVIS